MLVTPMLRFLCMYGVFWIAHGIMMSGTFLCPARIKDTQYIDRENVHAHPL